MGRVVCVRRRFANKQDLPEAMTVAEVAVLLGLTELKESPLSVFSCM